MRRRFARFLLYLTLLTLLVAFVFIWRARSQNTFGPAVALCPGPDHYGYRCEGGAGYTYIDAAAPTGLMIDDGVMPLALPFGFNFYGTTYTSLQVSSNGNAQFRTGNPLYKSACLSPAVGMGDMIAPYWADLDLSVYGALETAVLGDPPARVFVIEWDDVPVYGPDSSDRVTFEIQLFEATNDIVFLYEDPQTATGGNGGAAVVGIQSERQRLALTYSCHQPALPAPGGLRLAHPAAPNRNVIAPAGVPGDFGAALPFSVKGPLAELLAAYEVRGPAVLAPLQQQWVESKEPLAFVWRGADVNGDGVAELVAAWSGGTAAPERTEVAVLSVGPGQSPGVLFNQRLTTRAASYTAVVLAAVADLTGDDREDVVLRDGKTGTTWVLSAAGGAPALLSVPALCTGSLTVRDTNSDGRLELIRDGCDVPGRVSVIWGGAGFVIAR